VGVAIGAPVVWGAPVVSGFSAVPVDVEENFIAVPPASVQAAAPTTYWYYCTSPAGYYPYVQSCNQAWIPVVPQSAPPAGG
jgi:hypothetical protein